MTKRGTLRVRAYTRWETDYGYVEKYPHRYQDLEIKRWWGWEKLDTEEVPAYVEAYNAVGGSGWQSKFSKLGKFGRDGIIELN